MRYYSKRFTVYYYPGHWIQYKSCTHSAPSQLPIGSILARCYFWGAHKPNHATNNVRILPGTHLYTWVESSNVDKVSCWRTKSARHWRESNPEPFDPESTVQSNIPWHLHNCTTVQLCLTGADPGFPWGGGGRKRLCTRTHITSAEPNLLWAGVQGPLKGPESSRVVLMVSSAIWALFLSIIIKKIG